MRLWALACGAHQNLGVPSTSSPPGVVWVFQATVGNNGRKLTADVKFGNNFHVTYLLVGDRRQTLVADLLRLPPRCRPPVLSRGHGSAGRLISRCSWTLRCWSAGVSGTRQSSSGTGTVPRTACGGLFAYRVLGGGSPRGNVGNRAALAAKAAKGRSSHTFCGFCGFGDHLAPLGCWSASGRLLGTGIQCRICRICRIGWRFTIGTFGTFGTASEYGP